MCLILLKGLCVSSSVTKTISQITWEYLYSDTFQATAAVGSTICHLLAIAKVEIKAARCLVAHVYTNVWTYSFIIRA